MTATITRLDIALLQLDRALDLYQSGGVQNLVCAITLAGAAEEILGRLVQGGRNTTALNDTLDMLCGMHKAIFPNDEPDRKKYADLQNKVRNDFKHITDNLPFSGELDREARRLIKRAMANHQKLGGGFAEKYRRFNVTLVERARSKQQDV